MRTYSRKHCQLAYQATSKGFLTLRSRKSLIYFFKNSSLQGKCKTVWWIRPLNDEERRLLKASKKKLSSLQFTPPNPASTCCYRKCTETQTKGLAFNWFHWNVVMNANGAEASVPSPTADLACQCSTFSLNDEEAGVSGLAFITVRGGSCSHGCVCPGYSWLVSNFNIFVSFLSRLMLVSHTDWDPDTCSLRSFPTQVSASVSRLAPMWVNGCHQHPQPLL